MTATATARIELRDIERRDHAGLLALNARHETELSPMTAGAFETAVATAWYAGCAPDDAAMLLAYDEKADLASANFRWFQARYDRFIYIDRVVVAHGLRGLGLGNALYTDLTTRARAAGHTLLTAEVNVVPPNPASMAFHVHRGFFAVGEARLPVGKTVAYLVKDIET